MHMGHVLYYALLFLIKCIGRLPIAINFCESHKIFLIFKLFLEEQLQTDMKEVTYILIDIIRHLIITISRKYDNAQDKNNIDRHAVLELTANIHLGEKLSKVTPCANKCTC